jgi:hypothetical protein
MNGDNTFDKKLEEQKKLVSQLKTISIENMACAMAILESFLNPKTMKKLEAAYPKPESGEQLSTEQLRDILSKKISDDIEDSRVITQEIDLFCGRIVEHKKPSLHETPFLTKIWSGEMYGVGKYSGLAKVLEDVKGINARLKKINGDVTLLVTVPSAN